jgi:DNA-3-methyladenine glycosylase II
MAEVRDLMSERYGATFPLAGERRVAVPTPTQLLEVSDLPRVPAEKLARMHGVARAAIDGRLDVERLVALGPDAAAEACSRSGGSGLSTRHSS